MEGEGGTVVSVNRFVTSHHHLSWVLAAHTEKKQRMYPRRVREPFQDVVATESVTGVRQMKKKKKKEKQNKRKRRLRVQQQTKKKEVV